MLLSFFVIVMCCSQLILECFFFFFLHPIHHERTLGIWRVHACVIEFSYFVSSYYEIIFLFCFSLPYNIIIINFIPNTVFMITIVNIKMNVYLTFYPSAWSIYTHNSRFRIGTPLIFSVVFLQTFAILRDFLFLCTYRHKIHHPLHRV